jgi:ribosomal subunit interface protein
MDVIVKGRRTDVNDRFRRHVDAKLAKIEKLDQKVIRVDVEVSQERNPRQADRRERVELTIRSRGPVIRAEAAADDRYGALDLALGKLESRLRKTCDRRKVHHGTRAPAKLATMPLDADEILSEEAAGLLEQDDPASPDRAPGGRGRGSRGGRSGRGQRGRGRSAGRTGGPDAYADRAADRAADSGRVATADRRGGDGGGDNGSRSAAEEQIVPISMEGDGPLVVREKFHQAEPMSIDQALYEMELVGHDFFLFRDTDGGRPSVVYRRRGWDYGVIRLVED